MTFQLDASVTVGDILMSLSIIVSVTALIVAWTKDRRLREREQADRIRNAAARTLSKLERWQDLSLSLFQDLQPLFVETSEMLKKKFDIFAARDFLWREQNTVRLRTLQRIRDEQIETAYAELYGYHPRIRQLFRTTLADLKAEEEVVFAQLLKESQKGVLSFQGLEAKYTTAQLGDVLRGIAWKHYNKYSEQLVKLTEPIQQLLAWLVLTSDKDLLRKNTLPANQLYKLVSQSVDPNLQ